MEATYPAHERYKPSGHDWVGVVPSHWTVEKLGTSLRAVSEKNRPDLPLLSITREKGVIERDLDDEESNHNFIPDDLSGYKVLRAGQFGMNKMKAWQGSYGVSQHTGIVSPAYFIFDFTKEIDPDFFSRAIRSKLYVSFFGSASDGVRIGQWDLNKARMREIPLLVPPLPEQRAIAAFLDDKCDKIDGAVKIKEDQIELLGERRQIIIQEAVTRGLNPTAPMKNSGIDCIGLIPAHWAVKPCRYAFRSVRRSDRNGSEIKLSVTQKRGIVPTDEMEENSNQAKDFDGFQICHPNDLVLNKYKAHLGVFWMTPSRGIITNNYTVFRPLNGIVSKYFEVLFHTEPYIAIFRNTVYGVTEGMAPLYTGDFYGLPAICPPEEEQLGILGHIAELSAKFENAISIKEAQISALKEYKTSLINAAVTGKIKVI